jgi:lipopolysaccharide/colanic/teichoic acid biosynthesis glycosyltransferase
MASTRIWSWIGYRGATPALLGDYLSSRRQFQASLRRERLRADRNLTQLSLVTLSLGRRSGDLKSFSIIADVLEARVRGTDEAGWFAKRTIGIILPDTPVDGAWKLVDDLRSLLAKRGISPQFSVYAYPSIGDGDTEVEEERRATPVRRAHHHTAVQPLEVLFLQKLPIWKRALDIVGASVGIVLTSPIMLLAALAIKVTSPGPVIFKQRRDTIGGRPFAIYKFRTMVVDAEQKKAALLKFSEQDGPAFKIAKDPRITRLGRFLRVTSIDELPQLFNILAGDMTLVGPRAMDSKESQHCERWQRRRLDVTAGLTCIWQVRGRSAVPFAEWMRMDLTYIHSRSLSNDLKLIAQTVLAVLRRRGAC